jgi:hypothetical protein
VVYQEKKEIPPQKLADAKLIAFAPKFMSMVSLPN